MLIGISGKIGAGKDTVGKIIQYLVNNLDKTDISFEEFNRRLPDLPKDYKIQIEIKKFADKLKDTVCLWTGCTREQLEDHNFKDTEIGPDWVRCAKAIGFGARDGQRIMWSNTCTKEEYEEEYRTNWQTAYKINLTYRHLLQLLGTECMRNTIHLNGWVNALFSEYKPEFVGVPNPVDIDSDSTLHTIFPNWIITDMRFSNELDTVKSRGGITIRVEKPVHRCDCTTLEAEDCNKKCSKSVNLEHESETALDGAAFDYVIHNDGTIEELIEKVKVILIEEKLLCQM